MRFYKGKFYAVALFLSFFFYFNLSAQSISSGYNANGSNNSAIPTAVPFLNISPDARSGAMGDAGVAISADANANYWNPAKLAFINGNSDISLSYSPWLRKLAPGISLSYLSFAHELNNRNSIGFSVRYFNYGTIDLFDENQTALGTYQPNEFSIDGSLARKFGDNFSLGLTLRYIRSSVFYGAMQSSERGSAANAFSTGISLFSNNETEQFGDDAIFAFGMNISNIGTKIGAVNGSPGYFLPANLKIGAANTLFIDDLNKITLTLDLNKLLVPTPPIRDENGVIIKGKDDNRSVVSGVFGSFTDAPGGFNEELQEINYSLGFEYWYDGKIAFRTGYFFENPNKGDRQYLTLGVGFKTNGLNIDFSYLAANQQQSPLSNTLRLALGYYF